MKPCLWQGFFIELHEDLHEGLHEDLHEGLQARVCTKICTRVCKREGGRAMKQDILNLLEKNSRMTDAEMATILSVTMEEVSAAVRELEADGIIRGYGALIDWEKYGQETVTAYIEVRVTPQRGQGFDKVAERIFQFPQVQGCSLMSGGFDLFVVVEGKTMKEVALFVAEKLAPIESVVSTSTHFVLRKYKDHGVLFGQQHKDEREAVVL